MCTKKSPHKDKYSYFGQDVIREPYIWTEKDAKNVKTGISRNGKKYRYIDDIKAEMDGCLMEIAFIHGSIEPGDIVHIVIRRKPRSDGSFEWSANIEDFDFLYIWENF